MTVVKEKEREPEENALVRTFRETRNELRKVVWPTREETIRLTVVVLAISAIIGLILFVGDSIFLSLYTLLVDLVS
jgi:preprotein translocase subunit SecE